MCTSVVYICTVTNTQQPLTMAAKTIINRKEKNQGMNWIRPVKRLAIYLHDGMACAYCNNGIEEGAKLTLDHVVPYSKGGSNKETNLVTCCHQCNSSRGNRAMRAFAAAAAYINHGTTADQIIKHVNNTRQRALPMAEAAELIARRGGFSAAMMASK